ncbi:UNVERIFIED_CONTAM: hypothetical protein K2H54_021978 [Gekko kuhli]
MTDFQGDIKMASTSSSALRRKSCPEVITLSQTRPLGNKWFPPQAQGISHGERRMVFLSKWSATAGSEKLARVGEGETKMADIPHVFKPSAQVITTPVRREQAD